VVIVAYGSQEKTSITGSVAKVDSSAFMNIPMTSFDQMLQGKVAGLQSVAVSGQPSALQEIRIRGIASLNTSSQPLFVIDGVPVNSGDFTSNSTTSNALAGLSPDDIGSITVLKDAAAASLYGARSGNGVILVTTKKGRPGKSVIDFDSEYGVGHAAFSNPSTKPLSAGEYTELTTEGLINAGLDTTSAAQYLNDVVHANNGYITNWPAQVSQSGVIQQYNISLFGYSDCKKIYIYNTSITMRSLL
jgi:TonB-dependent SusC/RagA subfamily outer membrane receptor